MKKFKLQISQTKLVHDANGSFVKIEKVKLMDEKGKYIKFAKLNEDLLNYLRNAIIEIEI
jgi:hypothetical protein